MFGLTACGLGQGYNPQEYATTKGPVETNPYEMESIGFLQWGVETTTLSVGESAVIPIFLYSNDTSLQQFSLYYTESDIVKINPSVCTLNYEASTPFCEITIIGQKVGSTDIGWQVLPGKWLHVNVVDNKAYTS